MNDDNNNNDNNDDEGHTPMNTSENPNVSPDDSADRFSMLELDLPKPAPTALGVAALAIIATIRAIIVGTTLATVEAAFNTLRTVCAPVGTWDEGPDRAAVRAAKDEKLAEIRSADRALKEVLPMPEAAPVAPAPVAPVVQVASTTRDGTFCKIAQGVHRGEWGLRIAGPRPAIGEVVLAKPANRPAQLKRVTEVIWTDGTSVSIVMFDDVKEPKAPKATKATAVAAPVVPAATNAQMEAAAPALAEGALAMSESTLMQTLADIGGEASANAGVAGMGSMAGGQLRGVGFSTAEGYVTALAHGVKAATAATYKQLLRSQFSYTVAQIEALNVTIIPEVDLPVGAGIVHAPTTGKAVSEMSREEARAHFLANSSTAKANAKAAAEKAATEAAATELQATMIAGLVSSGKGLVVSPGSANHGVSVPRGQLLDVLASIDCSSYAPKLKSNRAQFGSVMGTLNGNGLRAWAITQREATRSGEKWPADLVSRWIVGTVDGGAELGSLGNKELVVELLRNGALRFVGGNESLRLRVTEAFEARCAEQAYNATDMLGWLRRVLFTEHYGVTWGGFIFCPGSREQTAAIRTFINTVRPLLGRQIGLGEAISDDGMVDGIAESLASEIAVETKALAEARKVASARDRAKAAGEGLDVASQDLAAARAEISAEVASTRLRKLDVVVGRIEGFAMLLGTKIEPLRKQVKALAETLRGLVDDTTLMASQIELDTDGDVGPAADVDDAGPELEME